MSSHNAHHQTLAMLHSTAPMRRDDQPYKLYQENEVKRRGWLTGVSGDYVGESLMSVEKCVRLFTIAAYSLNSVSIFPNISTTGSNSH